MVSYEQRELSLEVLIQLYKVTGFFILYILILKVLKIDSFGQFPSRGLTNPPPKKKKIVGKSPD